MPLLMTPLSRVLSDIGPETHPPSRPPLYDHAEEKLMADPGEFKRIYWLGRVKMPARRHAVGLAQLASAVSDLMYRNQTLAGADIPAEERTDVPEASPEELSERDMPIEQAAELLRDFFSMPLEGEARLRFLLELEGTRPSWRRTDPLGETLIQTVNAHLARYPDTTDQEILQAISLTVDALQESINRREDQDPDPSSSP